MSSSSGESDVLSPENSRTEEYVQNLLPTKSREKYMKAYNNFIEWKDANGERSFSETVFLNYFQKLAESKQPTTLWSTYSMLKSTIWNNNDIKIETYTKLLTFLKRQAKGHKSKKSKVFSSQNVETFLNEAPDNDFLAIKVALIFGVHGACRGNELLNITVNDIEKHSDRLLLVKLKDTKTKIDRSFIIREEYKTIVEKYQALRPPDMQTNRFFIRYHNGRCFKQVIGKNKICSMPQEIATYLKLPDPKLYTGHCFRRTSSTLLTHSGADLSGLMRHGGWKSVVKRRKEDFIEDTTQMGSSIVENVNLEDLDDSPISQLSHSSTLKQRESHSGTDFCDHNLHEEWKSGTLAEVYIEDSTENKAQMSQHIVENVKLEYSPTSPISPLSPCPSTSKREPSPFAHSGTDMYDRKRQGEWKSSTVAEDYLEDSTKNKAQTRKHIKNIKLESSAIPPISPLSPSPSTSKQCESNSSQNEHIFHGPDSIVITSTQTSTTISILNKAIKITFEKCPDDSNSLNIKF